MTVAIVTDTGCDLPQDMLEQINSNVKSIPLTFRFGQEEFIDKSIPMPVFLQRVEKAWPTTSAPSPGDYVQAFRSSLEDHDQVVCITLTSKHSASYASALLASQDFPAGQVTVIDSASLSIGQGFQVLAASKMARSGASPDEVAARVRAVERHSRLFIALDTVKFLVRGGRANHMTGILAGILQIRPILTLREGQLTLLEKPRGRMVSKQNLLRLATHCFPAEFVAVGHVGCEEEAEELAAALALATGLSKEEISIIETGMAIATHAGPRTLGILVVSKAE